MVDDGSENLDGGSIQLCFINACLLYKIGGYFFIFNLSPQHGRG